MNRAKLYLSIIIKLKMNIFNQFYSIAKRALQRRYKTLQKKSGRTKFFRFFKKILLISLGLKEEHPQKQDNL